MKLGIVGGTSISRSEVFGTWESVEVETEYGRIELKTHRGIVLAHRHGFGLNLLPHASNYRGYVTAMSLLGVDSVLTASSVGSLKPDLLPGTMVSCSDYVSFAPMTFDQPEFAGGVPEIRNDLVDEIAAFAGRPIGRDKVYVQTRGPRFEPPAEVRILQQTGCDVVGMTFANEADLFLERGISLSSLCMVDNFANGIRKSALSLELFHENVQNNQEIWDGLFLAVVEHYGD